MEPTEEFRIYIVRRADQPKWFTKARGGDEVAKTLHMGGVELHQGSAEGRPVPVLNLQQGILTEVWSQRIPRADPGRVGSRNGQGKSSGPVFGLQHPR